MESTQTLDMAVGMVLFIYIYLYSLLVRSGRTHQLRVHCSAVGHPIVGDFTYSLGVDDAPYRMMLHAHLLRLPLKPHTLQVTAGDPFLPNVDPKWLPQRTLRTAEVAVESLLDSVAAMEKQLEEEKEKKWKAAEERRKGKKKKAESEEQKRLCQDWLSEWGGEWMLLRNVLYYLFLFFIIDLIEWNLALGILLSICMYAMICINFDVKYLNTNVIYIFTFESFGHGN